MQVIDYCKKIGDCVCENYANNYVEFYFKKQIAKCKLVNDTKKLLEPIFKKANYKTMLEGVIPIIIGLGWNLTIGSSVVNYRDKNEMIYASEVQITINGIIKRILVIDWKIFDERFTTKEQKINTLLFLQAIKIEENKIIKVKTFFECFYSKNNIFETPSLRYLKKIIWNIHELDVKADKNRELLNLLYILKSNKKLTKEQMENFGVLLSECGLGLFVTTLGKGTVNSGIIAEILTASLSRFEAIKNEILFWKSEYAFFSATSIERTTFNRENTKETEAKKQTINFIDEEYYDTRKELVNEYNMYYKINARLVTRGTAETVTQYESPRDLEKPKILKGE